MDAGEREHMLPCPRKKNKNQSSVWDHFSMKVKPDMPKSPENLDHEYVYCNYCSKRYKNHRKFVT